MSVPVELVEFAEWVLPEQVPARPLPEVVGAWGDRYGLFVTSESPRGGRARGGEVVFLVLGEEEGGVFTVEVVHLVAVPAFWTGPRPPSEVPETGRWRPPPGVEVRAGDVVLVHEVDLSAGPVWEALPVQWPERVPWVARLEVVSEQELRHATVYGAPYAYDRPISGWQMLVLQPARLPGAPPRSVRCAPTPSPGCKSPMFLLYDLPDLTPDGWWRIGRERARWPERVAEAVDAGGAVARVVAREGETLPDGSCRYRMEVVEPATGPLAPGERVLVDMDRVWCWLDLGRPLDGWTTLLPRDDGTWRSPAWWSTETVDHRPASVEPGPVSAEPLPPALLTGDPVVVEPDWLARNGNLFPAAWTRATGAVLGPAVCTVP